MKKVLVAAAGLMLAGTMASTAMADVTFSGDARARYYMQKYYDLDNDNNNFFNSRVRLQWKATTKGGAYVVGRFRLADAKWDGNQLNRAGADDGNLWVDKAYIGVPFGPVTIEAGLTYRNLTDFAYAWRGADAVDAIYKADNTTVRAFVQVLDEFDEGDANDAAHDDDVFAYGLKVDHKFSGGWALTAYGMYEDDEQTGFDNTGIRAGLKVGGAFGDATVNAEIAFIEEDVIASSDDGIGAYIEATMPMGAMSLYGIIGYAADGFIVDDDFAGQGYVLGNYYMIGGADIGGDGAEETYWVSVQPSYKVSEKLTVAGNVTYVNADYAVGDGDAWEIGAKAAYAVTDGASLNVIAGYADVEDADENPIGLGVSLEVSF